MTVIVDALNVLNQSLGALEAASIEQEQRALKLRQQDLFKADSVKANESMDFDTAVLAQKLDVTIEKVEQILEEG